MAETEKASPDTIEGILVASFAAADALAKLLSEKGLITEQEYQEKVSSEGGSYQRILEWIKREV